MGRVWGISKKAGHRGPRYNMFTIEEKKQSSRTPKGLGTHFVQGEPLPLCQEPGNRQEETTRRSG